MRPVRKLAPSTQTRAVRRLSPFVLVTAAPGVPPVFSGPIPNFNFTVNVAITPRELGAYFTGATSFALVGGPVTGLTLNTSTGQLSGTPTVPGTTSPLRVDATNANGTTQSNNFSITVAAVGGSYGTGGPGVSEKLNTTSSYSVGGPGVGQPGVSETVN